MKLIMLIGNWHIVSFAAISLVHFYYVCYRYHSHQYQCTQCDKKFGERSLLRSHLLSAHFDVRPYRCLVCDNSFAMKAHCQRHCRMHLRHQNFTCDGCELMFRYELDLMSHKNKGLCQGKSSNSLDAR